ncbi:MAG: imidazolonepropionase [Candidatus Eisenbacteria bacterium]|nr:imidazolonepropionase [Candidatus Eisenbacteria bacterium]
MNRGNGPDRVAATGLLLHAGQLVTLAGGEGPLRGVVGDAGVIPDGALAWRGEDIVWTGASSEAERGVELLPGGLRFDAGGRAVVPGLIDSHTHMVFAGHRDEEWEERLRGVSYAEIAARGGGILNTVRATRAAGVPELKSLAECRLQRALEAGVTTVEIKSGYGLSLESELKILEVVDLIRREGRYDVVPTFLGAHEVGPEFRGRRADFVREVARTWIPEVASTGRAEFFDVFCEKDVFELEDTRAMCEAALAAGLRLKLHADELHPLGGAGLAAELGSVSADHLVHASDSDLEKMGASGTIPVLLPGTSLMLAIPWARAARMLEMGLPVALATDCNPGTCYCENLPLIGSLALGGYRMPPLTALAAVTRNAACAVGRGGRLGRLQTGYRMDAVMLEEASPASLFYHVSAPHARVVWMRGEVAFRRDVGTPVETTH